MPKITQELLLFKNKLFDIKLFFILRQISNPVPFFQCFSPYPSHAGLHGCWEQHSLDCTSALYRYIVHCTDTEHSLHCKDTNFFFFFNNLRASSSGVPMAPVNATFTIVTVLKDLTQMVTLLSFCSAWTAAEAQEG